MDGDAARARPARRGGPARRAATCSASTRDGPLFAVDVDAPRARRRAPPRLIAAGGPRGSGAAPPAPADGPRPVALREAVAVLPQDEGGLVAYVAALLNWHRRHAFCAACGTPSDVAEGGLVRLCPRCGTHHHPRTDPVVIMLVDGRRPAAARPRAELAAAPLLRARRLRRAGGEPRGGGRPRGRRGERRRASGAPRYVASQPWPFPSSLMLGFEAPWIAGEPRAAGGRDRGRALVQPRRGRRRGRRGRRRLGRRPDPADPDATALLLPPRLAIARRLIERWLDEASWRPRRRPGGRGRGDVALVGAAAAADHRHVRQQRPQRGELGAEPGGVALVELVASSSSAWLRAEAFARRPAIRSRQLPPAASMAAKCDGCAQLIM